ncbi:MAG TPA: DUF4296 domain-containing protein [Flavipsychrobacter sp.]
MTRFLLLTFIVCTLSSCVEKEQQALSSDKMTEVLTDIYLAEVYSSIVNDTTGVSAKKNMDSLAVYYKSVLVHHGITLDQFSNSLRWYSSHPEEMDSVYVNVLNELSTMEGVQNASNTE